MTPSGTGLGYAGRLARLVGGGLDRNFAKLWSASGAANIADGVSQTAFPLLAAALTQDPLLVAGLTVALRLPWLLFALPAGAYVDRLDRRMAMVVVGFARAAVMSLLVIAAFSDLVSLPVLYAAAFLLGMAETVYDSASAAVIPAVVGRDADRLARANGRLMAVQSVAQYFIGPPLGAFLFAIALQLPFGLTSLAFAGSALLVLSMSGSFRPRDSGSRRAAKKTRLYEEISDGIAWLWRSDLMRAFGIMVAVLGFFSAGMWAILVIFALEHLGLDELGFGLLVSAGAVGSIIGSVTASPISKRIGVGNTITVSVGVAAATYLAMAATANPLVAATVFAINGWSVLLWGVVTVSARQSLIPDRLLGRAVSAYRLMAWGSMPLGAAVGGVLGRIDLRAPFIAGGSAFLLLTLYAAYRTNNSKIEAERSRIQSSE